MKYTVSIDTPEDEAQFQRFLAQHPGVVVLQYPAMYTVPGLPLTQHEYDKLMQEAIDELNAGEIVSIETLKQRLKI